MKFLTFLTLLCISFSTYASHVSGGDIFYEWVSPNTYNIKLRVYRDCNPGASTLASTATLGIYVKGTNGLQQTVSLSNFTETTNLPLGDSCYTPTTLCIDERIYFANNVFIAGNVNGYYLQANIYARSGAIDNIASPGSTSLSFYAEMPDPNLFPNSSPDFGNFPSDAYLCINNLKTWFYAVSDPDGDSLSYSLVTPLMSTTANGTQAGSGAYPYYPGIAWSAGYSLANVCGGSPAMSIDAITGEISASPAVMGEFVFAVRVEEFRFGIKIGEVRRDVQYASLNCTVDSPPVINMADTVVVFIGDSICVDMTVSDIDGTDTIYVMPTSVDFDLIGTYVAPTASGSDFIYTNFNNSGTNGVMSHFDIQGNVYEGVGEILLRYCWDPGCADIDTTYHIDLLAYSLGCSGSDTSQKGVVFAVDYRPTPINIDLPDSIKVNYDTEICFDMYASDVDETGFPLSLEPVGIGFDYASSYTAPIFNGQDYYYLDFQGLDTIYLEGYSRNGNVINGYDTVAVRYCWTPECGDVVMKNYSLDYKATIHGTCYDVSEVKTMQVQIDPPVGNVDPIPNIFTPNGDGSNDVFKLAGFADPCFDVMDIKIYNRWGKVVFKSEDPLFEWNGTNKNDGGKCADGTYFVLISGTYGSTYENATGERVPNPVDKQYTIQLMR